MYLPISGSIQLRHNAIVFGVEHQYSRHAHEQLAFSANLRRLPSWVDERFELFLREIRVTQAHTRREFHGHRVVFIIAQCWTPLNGSTRTMWLSLSCFARR